MEEGGTRWQLVAKIMLRDRVLDVTDPNPQPTLWVPDKNQAEEFGEHEDVRKPKLVLNFTRFDPQTFKSQQVYRHFVDVDTFGLLCQRIVNGETGQQDPVKRGQWVPLLTEHKGGKEEAAKSTYLKQDMLVARQLIVQWLDQMPNGEAMRSPGYQVTFIAKPGTKTKTGGISPVEGSQPLLTERILLPELEARRIALLVLRRLQAKETAAVLMAHWR